MKFEEFKKMLLYRRVVAWKDNTITLDNGIVISIEETEQDCCASASGRFTNVKLDAAITDVTEPKYKSWSNGDTCGCKAVVKMLHNQNLVCQANANADAGNGGYYYSIASFVVKIPNRKERFVHFVGSDDN
jgi:hypothetical protein